MSLVRISDMMRAQYVKRFHIVHTIKHQSIAEHSFNVAMISRRIAIEMGYDEDDVKTIMLAGLVHDLDEVITGDIPTPTKMRAKAQGVDLNDNGIEIPYQCSGLEWVNRIVKISDYIEAMSFMEENAIGIHALTVEADIGEKMESYIESTFTIEETTQILDVVNEIRQGGFTF